MDIHAERTAVDLRYSNGNKGSQNRFDRGGFPGYCGPKRLEAVKKFRGSAPQEGWFENGLEFFFWLLKKNLTSKGYSLSGLYVTLAILPPLDKKR